MSATLTEDRRDSTGMRDAGVYAAPRRTVFDLLPPAIIAVCATFNMALCFINTVAFNVSTPVIIGCEIILMIASAAYGFHRLDKVKAFWIMILFLQAILVLFLSLAKDQVLAKSLRDVIIMPVFIVLGLSAYRLDLTKFFLWFGAFVVVVGVLEAAIPEQYLSVFDIRKYYIGKGAMEDRVITDLAVFASGVRPGGRFLFDIPGVHRISSIFLEPVSLGFYAVIAAMYFIARKDQISRAAFWTGIAITFILIWLSDARLAMGTFAACFLLRPVFARVDHRFSVIFLPAMVLLAVVVDSLSLLDKGGEGLGARIYVTAHLLHYVTPDILLGVSKFQSLSVVDSGLGTLLSDQGLFGLMLYWLTPILFMRKLTTAPRIYTHSMAVFIAFSFIISPAFFSIKTASFLWFQLGYLIGRDMRDEDGIYRGIA